MELQEQNVDCIGWAKFKYLITSDKSGIQIYFVCKFNLLTCTNLNQLPSVLHQRPRVPFYDMGRKKVPCSHYVLRWNVLLAKMMVRKLEWLSHNGIDIENCSVQQCYKVMIEIYQTNIICSVLKVSKSQKENTKSKKRTIRQNQANILFVFLDDGRTWCFYF